MSHVRPRIVQSIQDIIRDQCWRIQLMREDAYRAHLNSSELKPSTVSTQVSTCRRMERDEGVDLDGEYETDGLASLISRFTYTVQDERDGRENPSQIEIPPDRLRQYLSFYRSAIERYRKFREIGEIGSDEVFDAIEDEDLSPRTFGLERDLQTALRENITQLEPGLEIVDGGSEKRVGIDFTGFVDILARDNDGNAVVVELKAGMAKHDAVSQILSYMGSLEPDAGSVRGILVASDFDPKAVAAARTVPTLTLKRYRFRFEFD